MTYKVEIGIKRLMNTIAIINRQEVKLLEDPKVRYQAEIGKEKEAVLKQLLIDSVAVVKGIVGRFLTSKGDSYSVEATAYTNTPKEWKNIEFEFEVSRRRIENKENILVDILFSLLCNVFLEKFYNSVSMTDFATKANAKATEDAVSLDKFINEKSKPIML